MPRKPRVTSPTGVYHFINRGINKRTLFHCHDDYQTYLSLLGEYLPKLGMKLYHYCLMTNHTHLLVWAEAHAVLSRFSHFVHRRYTYYYCKRFKWHEQLFKRRFASLPIDKDSYLMECGRYIERNPIRAGLVASISDYPYSSFRYYAYNEMDSALTSNPLYETLGNNPTERASAYITYVSESRPYEEALDKLLV